MQNLVAIVTLQGSSVEGVKANGEPRYWQRKTRMPVVDLDDARNLANALMDRLINREVTICLELRTRIGRFTIPIEDINYLFDELKSYLDKGVGIAKPRLKTTHVEFDGKQEVKVAEPLDF